MAPKQLTAVEARHAVMLAQSAQGSMQHTIWLLRSLHEITGDERTFELIHALEARHSLRDDCLGVQFNLDDLIASIKRAAAGGVADKLIPVPYGKYRPCRFCRRNITLVKIEDTARFQPHDIIYIDGDRTVYRGDPHHCRQMEGVAE